MTTQARKHNKTNAPKSMKKLAGALCAAGLLVLPGLAAAQVPLTVEGSISNVVKNADGSVTLTVFGADFLVQPGVPVATPTAIITNDQLADPTPFPGRTQPGFVGGTAIIDGLVIDGVATPLTVFVEPSENVLLGSVTANGTGGMVVQGVPVIEMPATELRMPSEGVHNVFGFPVIPATIPVGTGVAAEGYFAGGNFNYFLIEADAGTLVNATDPAVSVTRARCVPGGSLRVQGGAYLPDNATVEVRNALTGFVFGTATAVPDPAAPGFGAYIFDINVTAAAVNEDNACPSEVRVVRTAPAAPAGIEATAAVSGVVAPSPAPVDNLPPVANADTAATTTNLVTPIDLAGNDIDPNGNLDPSTIQLNLTGLPAAGVSIANNNDGTVTFQSESAGTFTFSYTVGDTGAPSLRSAPATVTVTVQAAAVDTVAIDRAQYRASQSRWNLRGTSNQPAVTVTATLVRTGQTIATAQADATGIWQIDARITGVVAQNGDVVRITSSRGGSAQSNVTLN